MIRNDKVDAKNGRFLRKYSINDNFLDEIGPLQAWFLGFMGADGHIVNDRTFSISQCDKV